MRKLYTVSHTTRATGIRRVTIARWFQEGRVEGAFRIGRGTRGGRWYAEADPIFACLLADGWKASEKDTKNALEQERLREMEKKGQKTNA